MNLKLEIRRNADNMIATDMWPDWEYNTYWWTEGNAACDCNREVFFLRAIGQDEPEDTECGKDRFSVRLTDADTGVLLYDELCEKGDG